MNYSDMVEVNQSFPTWVVILVFALVVLEITLKAMALWRAAQINLKVGLPCSLYLTQPEFYR